MSFRKAFLFTFILLAVAFAAVQLSDDSSADVKGIKDIIDLKGNVTLTDDITYKDGLPAFVEPYYMRPEARR